MKAQTQKQTNNYNNFYLAWDKNKHILSYNFKKDNYILQMWIIKSA